MYDEKTLNRFWDKIDVRDNNECWEWNACTASRGGYGILKVNGKRIRAHVLSYQIHKGEIPEGLFVCHSCDNPPCCNPTHLWLGTNQQNIKDAVDKGLLIPPVAKGAANGNAKLNDKQLDEIRELIQNRIPNTHIARIYGVTHSMISLIKLGKAWT